MLIQSRLRCNICRRTCIYYIVHSICVKHVQSMNIEIILHYSYMYIHRGIYSTYTVIGEYNYGTELGIYR